MKKALFTIATVTLFMQSCMRLDSNLFNNIKLSEYYTEKTFVEQEVAVDASYLIPDSLVHVFTLTSDDNGSKATIYAEYIGNINRIATDTVIMYFHGTKGHMDYYWNRTKILANTGGKNHFGVMTIDYRGYGKSEGKPTESGMYADGEAALQWLKNNGLTGDRLVIYGFSLGTSVATYSTANPISLVPAKLVLEAPFANAATMVQDAALLAIPPSYFTNLSVNNADQIKNVKQPFMWIHGTADDFLSITTHGEVVYKNYHGTYSEAHRITGAVHTDVPAVWGLENYKAALLAFIRR